MDTEAELIQKRLEVKDGILNLKEQILLAQIFNKLGNPSQNKRAGSWVLSIVLLNIVVLGPWGIFGLVLREFSKQNIVWMEALLTAEMVILSFVIAHITVEMIFDNLANQVVEHINNLPDLPKLLIWLKQNWSMKNIFLVPLPFTLLWIALSIGGMSLSSHEFIGVGISIAVILSATFAGMVVHVYLWICLLITNLKSYHYEMNAFSPADSEVVSNISDMLTRSIYILAGLFSIITLLATSSLIDPSMRNIMGAPLLVFGWAVILIQFILTRSTLSTITSKAKWLTLNKIRLKINEIEATGDLSDKDTAERLLRLADLHKQVITSKMNTFDLKSVSTLFSQLMLPLLGLLLGNLDKLLKLLP